ncbi:MAG: hypothetical protein NTZ14_19265, partial [Hyphomicrobiales bacterium]|nr:hypothetical protein [Hyphomicrobiales bacterium]
MMMDADGRNPGFVGQRQVDEVSTNIGYSSAIITSAKSIDRGDRFPGLSNLTSGNFAESGSRILAFPLDV